MFGKLSLVFLACFAVSVISQEFQCSRTDISNDLLTECANAVRYNSDILQATCYKNTQSYPPYKKNAKLQAAAQAHAEDMARNRFFSHSSYDGTSWYTRIESFGYEGESGENIARNYNTAFASLSTWYCSSGHRRSLLACRFDEIGSGLKCTEDRGCYAVQVFGCSTGRNCCETTEPTKPISSTVPPPSVVPVDPPSSPVAPVPPRSPPTISLEPSPSVVPVDPPSSPDAPTRPRSPPVVSTPPRSPDESPMASETPTPSEQSPHKKRPRYRYPGYRNGHSMYNPSSHRYGNRYGSRYGSRYGRR